MDTCSSLSVDKSFYKAETTSHSFECSFCITTNLEISSLFICKFFLYSFPFTYSYTKLCDNKRKQIFTCVNEGKLCNIACGTCCSSLSSYHPWLQPFLCSVSLEVVEVWGLFPEYNQSLCGIICQKL